jgi:formate dehydrogenase iron-sulfur subunit
MEHTRAMLVDITKCIGCRSCEQACKELHGFPKDTELKLSPTALTVVEEHGDKYVRRMCMHCEDPSCASACLVGALKKTALGPVTYDGSKCIGCRYCLVACPFSVPRYEWTKLAPYVKKCDMCATRQANGQPPACVEACPTGASIVGWRDEILEEAQWRVLNDPKYMKHIYGSEEAGGTSAFFISDVLVRTAVLVSFLGYMSVIAGMMYELRLPWRIWHPIVMWNRHSMLFEVSLCVMLYSTVLTFEFSPALVEKIPWVGLRTWYLKQQHRILIGLVLVGCVLSSLHQSFLGGLYLLRKGKLDPLWYTPYLTTLFYLSAIPAGLAVTVMALYLCVRSLNVQLDMTILSELGRVIAPMLALYGIFRGVDLVTHGALPCMFKWREETLSFWVEIGLFVVAPLVLLSMQKVRDNPQFLY